MKVLITGKNGQLGGDLLATAPGAMEITANDVDELDITDASQVDELVSGMQPEVIINAAAYTAVDKAESEPDLARAVNATGPANLATAAKSAGSFLIHVSTDFVFDGNKSSPWQPGDPVNPVGEYGKTKAEGEKLVREILGEHSLILRTSWVYSVHGHNFVKTMLRLMQERDEVRVVSDQTGSPTWSRNLARVIWELIEKKAPSGIYHWSDAGKTSWYDFACAIYEEGRRTGLVQREVNMVPITTDQYPTPARRPAYSVLDTTGTQKLLGHAPQPWREALREMLTELSVRGEY